jgi:glutaconate CoA-transferase subunit B
MGLTESLVLSRRYCWISADFRGLSLKLLFDFEKHFEEGYISPSRETKLGEEVRADIPWDLQVAETISSFPVPRDEEIDFLRRFSPSNSLPNAVALQMTTDNLLRKLATNR